ncbi:uncharacterized protein LOC129947159 isoform X2 [Eupeodes corollae]|uniref:uncharacterized protein LOC129947159 isoform X2 n=1 Tax=Eupeodes corollae TaxID=290404 RepID=UPI00249041BE|nr:uncharacterized protein LOC129947159 isoform X2 [Eupeodes corollae]
MANEDRKAHLNAVKFLELAFAIACLVLHFYSFNDGDIITSFLATGILMRAPIHKRIDIFFSVIGCCLFVTSGVLLFEAWEYSFRTRTRDLAMVKASLAIVDGALFGFDAIFTLKDK